MEQSQDAVDCTFCGARRVDAGGVCHVCKSRFASEEEIAAAQDELRPNDDTDELQLIPLTYEEEHGFSHPDWKAIWDHVRANLPQGDRFAFYHELAKQWLLRLKNDLGLQARNHARVGA